MDRWIKGEGSRPAQNKVMNLAPFGIARIQFEDDSCRRILARGSRAVAASYSQSGCIIRS